MHTQVLQAKVAALELEDNAKMPSVLSDPTKVPDACVAAAMPTHKPASAAVALKTSLDVPLLGQPLLEPSPQVLYPHDGLFTKVSQLRLVLALYIRYEALMAYGHACRGRQRLPQGRREPAVWLDQTWILQCSHFLFEFPASQQIHQTSP